tara:strand:+ start:118 stop:306 length:189 start_codon:yes stop_codon:yes gene_type:complete
MGGITSRSVHHVIRLYFSTKESFEIKKDDKIVSTLKGGSKNKKKEDTEKKGHEKGKDEGGRH